MLRFQIRMEIDRSLLYRFFSREATPQEADAIASWLKEDPSNRKTFDREYSLFMSSQVSLNEESAGRIRKGGMRQRGARILAFAASVAAALFAGVLIERHFHARPALDRMGSAMISSHTPQGQTSTVTLPDGTEITLNSNSTIEYPAVFSRGERRVKLEGEALFSVTHDRDNPFIVETYAYEVKVLGTKFDVEAYSDEGVFTTSLVEGSVAVQDGDGTEILRMEPSQRVSLSDGVLVRTTFEGTDDFLWTEGVVSASGVPFDELMRKFRRAYGVNISIDRQDLPRVDFSYLKFRVSDGIEHALGIMQKGSDFKWEYDSSTDTYHIR